MYKSNMNRIVTAFTDGLSQCVRINFLLAVALLVSAMNSRAADGAPQNQAGSLAPLPLQLPPPAQKGTPPNLATNTTAEPFTDKPRPAFLAPAGVKNVALGKPVTSSDSNPISGELKQITDGKKASFEENVVTLRRRLQWVQLDLQGEFNLYAIVIWHEFTTPVVYRDVIVQVSDDPEFKTDVHTLFNNDQANTSGLRAGADREYYENPLTADGKLDDAKGVKARYVRCYSNGNTENALNSYIEIEVFGLPAS